MGAVPKCFVLYGGTALALRLGHRESIDFDFFTAEPFDPQELYESIDILAGAKIVQDTQNTLSVVTASGNVDISFFGGLPLRTVFESEHADNGISIASIADIFGCKCAVVQSRGQYKDYIDIAAILERTEYDLAYGLACARAVYGDGFQPEVTLKALSSFNDLDKSIPESQAKTLSNAVSKVDLSELPSIKSSGLINPVAKGGNPPEVM